MVRVWVYDVWGNKIDGWQVNDRFEIGTYKDKDYMMQASDQDIISWLKEEGHITKGLHLSSFQIDGDGDEYLTIDYQGKPLMEVTKI